MTCKELPAHLARMALFAVNTGCRDAEICHLRWAWEVRIPELNASVFIISGKYVKNGEERLVIVNRVAQSVIDEVRALEAANRVCSVERGQPKWVALRRLSVS